MYEKYFYLALTPTGSSLAFIYSKTLRINYNNDSERDSKQTELAKKFREHNGNPLNYNNQWSVGYDDVTTANKSRIDEINALKNSGKVVKTPDWPTSIAI